VMGLAGQAGWAKAGAAATTDMAASAAAEVRRFMTVFSLRSVACLSLA
jgi:hypothetical protein